MKGMDVKAVGQMGRSIVVDTGDGRMAEIKSNGALGVVLDTERFMSRLGGQVTAVVDTAAAADAVTAAASVLPAID